MNSQQPRITCRCRGHGAPEIIEPCIRELVDCLNRHGVSTYNSCCGHGSSPGFVALAETAIRRDPSGGWQLLLNIKSIKHPYSTHDLEWVNSDGKPWWQIVRQLIGWLKQVVPQKVLRDILLDE